MFKFIFIFKECNNCSKVYNKELSCKETLKWTRPEFLLDDWESLRDDG